MFLKNSNAQAIVLSRLMRNVTQDTDPVRLILTPQFYLFKKASVPLKYPYQAKKIAPSVFEDEFGNDSTVRYFVFRCDDSWCFIAYRPEEILSFLQSKGLDAKRIEKVYFAQQFLEAFQQPYRLDERHALVSIDDTVAVVPIGSLHETLNDRFDAPWPTKGVRLTAKHQTGGRYAYVSGALLFLLAAMWSFEAVRYQKGTESMRMRLAQMVRSNPQLQARYTRRNILKKYRTIDQTERTKREILQTLSRYVFEGITLQRLSLDRNGFTMRLLAQNEKKKSKLIDLAKRNGINARIEGGEVVLQGRYL